MEEEGCVTEALHDEVSIDDDYDEVVAVIVDEDNDDKDDKNDNDDKNDKDGKR